MILKAIVTCLIFAFACWLSYKYGNAIVVRVWLKFADKAGVSAGQPSKMAATVGDLERIIYIFGAIAEHYEVIAGWLIMKAFFGWIKSGSDKEKNNNPEIEDKNINSEMLRRYNEFVIGNALSLIIGVGIGVCAHFLIGLILPSSIKLPA